MNVWWDIWAYFATFANGHRPVVFACASVFAGIWHDSNHKVYSIIYTHKTLLGQKEVFGYRNVHSLEDRFVGSVK